MLGLFIRLSLAMIEKHAVLGDVSFYDLLNIPGILRIVPESATYSLVTNQWVTGATASSTANARAIVAKSVFETNTFT
jgi:hypothetical protein